jgi:hypothetical protein
LRQLAAGPIQARLRVSTQSNIVSPKFIGCFEDFFNLEHPLFLFTPFILKDLGRGKGEKIQQQ